MTPEQCTARALKIIGPNADRAAIEEAVHRAGRKPIRQYGRPKTKGEKRTAQQLRDALGKVKKLLPSDDDLISSSSEWLRELDRLQRAADRIANSPLRKPSRFDRRKQRAVGIAAGLLEHHGLRLILARKSQFERLAAVLYGDESADFFHYCQAFIHRPLPGRK